MSLIEGGVACSFDLFEISEGQRAAGNKLAQMKNLGHCVRYLETSPLEYDITPGEYDMVYWDNALHHMLDAEKAVRWSKTALKAGGFFVMNDFVGPSRFQWTDFNLAVASHVRALLPERLLRNPHAPATMLSKKLFRPDPVRMLEIDPSEAADSESILPAVRKYFPEANITLTGGCIYHLCLNDVIANFKPGDDDPLLDLLLFLDDFCCSLQQTHYAFAIAIK